MHGQMRCASSPSARWISDGAVPMTCHEVEYRMRRLLDEAASERLVAGRDGIRQHLGHALIALGRAIHGVQLEHVARPALRPG